MAAITIPIIDSFLLFLFFYFCFRHSFYELPRIILDFVLSNPVTIRTGMAPFKPRIQVLFLQQLPQLEF